MVINHPSLDFRSAGIHSETVDDPKLNAPAAGALRNAFQWFCAVLKQGSDAPAATFHIGCRWFLATVSLCFGIAFCSLWVQLDGLYGVHGIAPIRDLMFHAQMSAGVQDLLMNPTLFWIQAGDGFLHLVCGLGVLFSMITLLGWFRGPGILLLWICYLSFCTAGAPFLNFQWDNLLLEVGFISVLLISWRCWKPGRPEFHPLVRWLGVFLLFRLMFASGVVKLTSGDPVWASMSALEYHFWTQPLPGPLAWWMHQLPELLLVLSAALMFAIELVLPFCFFLHRRFRLIGAGATILLQIAILLTGNYGFFNLLSIGLCFLLIDDAAWHRLSFGRLQEMGSSSRWLLPDRRLWNGATVMFAVVVLFMSSIQWFGIFRIPVQLPSMLQPLYATVASTRSINSYGLFATMTTSRLELTIEGSHDGTNWQAYRFRWKPNTIEDRLPLVAPHMPRVDWQLWFTALTPPQSSGNRWLQRVCSKLLVGNQEVLGLLEENPFPDAPPKWIRIRATGFMFTDWSERRESGHIWKAEGDRIYWPPMRLPE